ncbi:extracellular matrix protein 1 [Sceloporus undulatus]|uniref:extracellular matrix protein 1 n=1 Tax=Sceloporus undulatus TaxID=8520 RepID=UPI001C4CCFD4|nr:extracellular matrix protein 1 [Sceloporus undulatus]
MAQKMMLLGLLLALWLALAKAATLAPKGDEAEKPPLQPFDDDVLQQQIAPDEIPLEFLFQKEIDLGEGLDLPVLIHGEPQVSLSGPIGPRARRPSGCFNGLLCTRAAPLYRLDEFPPARPTTRNIGNICNQGRKKLSYGPWNLPQTSYSHLSRQGDALNNLEAGVSECCQLEDDEEKLPCCAAVWSDVLEKFCDTEFSIKTRPYHCCKMRGLHRERCFVKEATFLDYDFKNQTFPEEEPYQIPSGYKEEKNLKISFPPGQPTKENMKNICQLRKFRNSVLAATSLPLSHFGWFVRQAKALNRVEKEFKKCCRKEDIGCARKGWEKALTQYCRQEFSVKTRPHMCCKEGEMDARFNCFNNLAPYPAYDKEIKSVSLADITSPLLDSLCGQFTLLSKGRQIPALIQNITEPCCQLQGSERIDCAKEEKTQFIANLCGTQRKSWKDPESCCAKEENEVRESCFNSNYLSNVALASVEQATAMPTEPAVTVQPE